ncbi:hypothetical protein RFI_24409, partial [Reticulomyxa filosa]
NWTGMSEFGVLRGLCLVDMKNELLRIINDLVFMNDGTKFKFQSKSNEKAKEANASGASEQTSNADQANNGGDRKDSGKAVKNGGEPHKNEDDEDDADDNENENGSGYSNGNGNEKDSKNNGHGHNEHTSGAKTLTASSSPSLSVTPSSSFSTTSGSDNNGNTTSIPIGSTLNPVIGIRVRSRGAFAILERVYQNTWSQWTRMEVLTRILIIMYQANNVQFLIDLHALEPLLLRMPCVEMEERKKVMSILEFVIQSLDADSPPLSELSALKQLLREATDKDMVTLLLQTISKTILERPSYKLCNFFFKKKKK